MNELLVTALLLGSLTVTSYRSVPSQTDDSPHVTSTGEKTSVYGCAVSQDLLCGACRRLHRRCNEPGYTTKLHYGDLLYTDVAGFRFVNDVMGKYQTTKIKTKNGTKKVFIKQTNWIDVWVPSLEAERSFHRKYGVASHKVWVIKKERI